ncbi:hypothetical protein C8R47DRAFT_760464 [Mycena vitilis]|nr:hypothetical protein C8R47DRAFT_760464 [Mycena vitilis]
MEDTSDLLRSLVASWILENRHIDPAYVNDPAACSQLLRNQPAFCDALKAADLAKDYGHIRDSPFLLRPNTQDTRDFLQKIRVGMRKYVDGSSAFRPWDPKSFDEDVRAHLATLGLFNSGNQPSLLLDRLGQFPDDPAFQDRVRGIFVRGKDTFLVNTSGSGKTRLAFEGLCQEWGFYFSAMDESSGYAAQDITNIIKNRILDAGFSRELPPFDSDGFMEQLAVNQKLAAHHFNAALLARLLMFQIFAEIMHETGPLAEHKMRWLLFQLRPRIGGNVDSLVNLTHKLTKDEDSYTNGNITETMEKIRTIFGKEIHIFYVLDEAQVAATFFPSAFFTGGQLHPVLPEIIRAWRTHTVEKFDVSFVIAGTQIPRWIFDCEGNRSSRHRWTSDTGAFNESTQRRYIEHFLPPTIAESQTADRLISRAWNWVRGRHRFTSGLVTQLLMNGFLPADAILDDYFNNFARVPPSDSDTEIDWVDTVLKKTSQNAYSVLNFSLLASRSLMSEDIRQILFHYLVTGKHPKPFGADSIEMVTEGFGRANDAEIKEILVDEPLVLVGAANWLLGCSQSEHDDAPPPHDYYSLLCREPPSDPKSLAKCVAYYLTYAFDHTRRLCDVLYFPGPCPKWAKQNARLVAIHSANTGIDVSEDDFAVLATVSESMTETVSWLQHKESTPFCIPNAGSSPDLIFALKLADGTFIWVVVQAAVSAGTNLKESEVESLLNRLEDGQLFSEEDNDTLGNRARDALKGLPNLSSHLGPLGVLRVIASLPAHPRLGRLPLKSRHHAASLNMGLFKRIHEDIPAVEMVNIMAASVAGLPRVSNRREHDSDDNVSPRKRRKSPVPAPTETAAKRGKRKT